MFSYRSAVYISILCIVFTLAADVHAQDGSALSTVTLPGTEIRSLTSSHTGEQYDIYIQPVADTTSGQRYPAVYLLDAHWDFPMVTGIHGGLRADQFVPNGFLVGITYSGNPNYGALRAKDMTPTSLEGVDGSGRAPEFLAFIKEELIPFIESEYPIDPTDRTLMGSSYGGLFTLFALFHEPGLFHQYVAPSSSLWWDDGVLFQYEEALAQQQSDLPVKLFMTAGEFEGDGMIVPMQKLEKALASREYPNLQMEAMVVPGARHSSVKPESFMRGLRYAFAPDTLSLAPDALQSMIGRYKLDVSAPQELIFAITLEEGQLFLEMEWDGNKEELYAESDTTFFFRETPTRFMIEHAENNTVKQIKIERGNTMVAHRVE